MGKISQREESKKMGLELNGLVSDMEPSVSAPWKWGLKAGSRMTEALITDLR